MKWTIQILNRGTQPKPYAPHVYSAQVTLEDYPAYWSDENRDKWFREGAMKLFRAMVVDAFDPATNDEPIEPGQQYEPHFSHERAGYPPFIYTSTGGRKISAKITAISLYTD